MAKVTSRMMDAFKANVTQEVHKLIDEDCRLTFDLESNNSMDGVSSHIRTSLQMLDDKNITLAKSGHMMGLDNLRWPSPWGQLVAKELVRLARCN